MHKIYDLHKIKRDDKYSSSKVLLKKKKWLNRLGWGLLDTVGRNQEWWASIVQQAMQLAWPAQKLEFRQIVQLVNFSFVLVNRSVFW